MSHVGLDGFLTLRDDGGKSVIPIRHQQPVLRLKDDDERKPVERVSIDFDPLGVEVIRDSRVREDIRDLQPAHGWSLEGDRDLASGPSGEESPLTAASHDQNRTPTSRGGADERDDHTATVPRVRLAGREG